MPYWEDTETPVKYNITLYLEYRILLSSTLLVVWPSSGVWAAVWSPNLLLLRYVIGPVQFLATLDTFGCLPSLTPHTVYSILLHIKQNPTSCCQVTLLKKHLTFCGLAPMLPVAFLAIVTAHSGTYFFLLSDPEDLAFSVLDSYLFHVGLHIHVKTENYLLVISLMNCNL